MDLLKGAATFIGWLSGALAAVAAILYAFGYLVTLANLHALGLDLLVLSFDPLFYLQRGSRFTVYVAVESFAFVLGPLVGMAVVTFVWLVAQRALRHRPLTRKLFRALKAVPGLIRAWRYVIYALLLLILMVHMSATYQNITSVLEISDLLHASTTSSSEIESEERRAIREALVQRKDDDRSPGILGTKFLFSLFFFLEAIMVLYLAWQLTGQWRFRLLFVSPFACIFAMIFITLPMIYGVIVLPNEYSIVHIVTKDGRIGAKSDYYLLNKTSEAFVLWDERVQRVLWLPVKVVQEARIGRRRPISFVTKKTSE